MLSTPILRPPFFEIGPKAYLAGDAVIDLARAADEAACANDVQVLFTAPYLELSRVAESCPHLVVEAPHMDAIEPGRGLTKILAESVVAAGAKAVMLNHAEAPLDLDAVAATIARANAVGLAVVVCASSIREIEEVAKFGPDVIVAEPTELIGTGTTSDLAYMQTSTDTVKAIDPRILVLQGAGISNPDDVYRVILAGADATGSSSAIAKAPDPGVMASDMIAAVRRAWDARQQSSTH